MNWRGWILPGLLIVLSILILWSPNTLWQLRRFGDRSTLPDNELQILRAENAYLKGQLAEIEGNLSIPSAFFKTIVADIYSRYPLNFKHELIINRGHTSGVNLGAAVFASVSSGESHPSSSHLFLVGVVATTSATRSIVKTVFNHGFQGAVRIGEKRVAGLLIGGLSPVITTIPREARLTSGDVVVSASPDLPLGAIFGRIKDIHPSSDELFKEASLEVFYDINNLTKVVLEVQ